MITPVFKLSSNEPWQPRAVETVEQLGTIDGAAIRLDALPAAGGRMNFPPGMVDAADAAVVGYHRVVEAVDLFWHQFWLWYLYNPWEILGVGRHEGDWEFVQLASIDAEGDRPVLVTASQHHAGEKREFWRCELDAGRPVIYVAWGSHANYFTAGSRGEDVDEADGRGQALPDIEWRDFGDAWSAWPGRWGNSTGAGQSPQSPGCQLERWSAPHVFHARAK